MIDKFTAHRPDLTAPAADGFAITPATTPLPSTTRAIYVGGGGDIEITMPGYDGTPVTLILRNTFPGVVLPVRCTHVLPGGTTATDLVGLV